MRIVFAGTPEFALPALENLFSPSHQICAVYTKPDSPSGRGLKLHSSAVKEWMIKHHPQIPIYQPEMFKDIKVQEQLRKLKPDLMVVIAYGLILPREVLTIPKYGCINLHASLLPRWRGAAPIQRAILAGDSETGVTIMQMDIGLDTGEMLAKKSYEIKPSDTAQTVHDKLATMGAKLLKEVLVKITNHTLTPEKQDHHLATYASKISKQEAQIHWHRTGDEIDRQIRAFDPWPGAYSSLNEQLIKIWKAKFLPDNPRKNLPGTVVAVSDEGIDVAVADGIIRVTELQPSGGKKMPVKDFLNSRSDLMHSGKTKLGEE